MKRLYAPPLTPERLYLIDKRRRERDTEEKRYNEWAANYVPRHNPFEQLPSDWTETPPHRRKMEIVEHQTLWYPGIYVPRTDGDWDKAASSLPFARVVELIQTRASQDGEWTLENEKVGGNEEKMRKMMAWVSRKDNIRQCIDANFEKGVTVDWVARELAYASKMVGG